MLEDGVPLGVDGPLPRHPEISSEKVKFRVELSDNPPHDCGDDNAASAQEHASFGDEQLAKDVELGCRIRVEPYEELTRMLGSQPVRGKLSVACRNRRGPVELRFGL